MIIALNSQDKLMDALLSGPKSAEELIKLVGAGAMGRISEWNKQYPKMIIKNIKGLYQFVRNTNLKSDHKKQYPQYHKNGTYQWPKKELEDNTVEISVSDIDGVPADTFGIFKPDTLYIGSSFVNSIETIEDNHRNWQTKKYKGRRFKGTKFRKSLTSDYKNKGEFYWIVEPFKCNLKTILLCEKFFLNHFNTELNVDKDPVAWATKNEDFKWQWAILLYQRGIYGFRCKK